MQEFFRIRRCRLQRLTAGQPGGHRGGKRATGSVGLASAQAFHDHLLGSARGAKNVDRLASAQMTAFEQNRRPVSAEQFLGRGNHRRPGGNFASKQHGRFIEIRRDDIGQRQKLFLVSAHGVFFQKRIAAARHHDRIDHEVEHAEAIGQFLRHHAEQGAGIKHAGFHRRDRIVIEKDADLGAQDIRRDRLHFLDATGHLRHDASHGGQTVGAERRERFEVGLDAGPARVVGAGDSEDDGRRSGRALTHSDAAAAGGPIGRGRPQTRRHTSGRPH